jgi:hypothetical protein
MTISRSTAATRDGMTILVSKVCRKERNAKCLRHLNEAAKKGLIGKHPDIVIKPAFKPEDGFRTSYLETFTSEPTTNLKTE